MSAVMTILQTSQQDPYIPKHWSAHMQGLPLVCEFMNRMWDATHTSKLILSGLNLRVIPAYVCELPLRTAVTELNLFQNNITRFPPEFGYLENLDVRSHSSWLFLCVCLCACVCTYAYVRMHRCVCIYIYTYIYIYVFMDVCIVHHT